MIRLRVWILSVLAMAVFAGGEYTGFKRPHAGEWADYALKTDRQTIDQKALFIGDATIDGKKAYGIETRMHTPDGMAIATQSWTNYNDGSVAKFVMEQNGRLMCMKMDMGMGNNSPFKPSLDTPEAFKPNDRIARYETYRLPSGQSVRAAVFKGGDNSEVWVSSDVPFGLVKVIDNGREVMHLKAYGQHGKPAISRRALACRPVDLSQMMGMPPR